MSIGTQRVFAAAIASTWGWLLSFIVLICNIPERSPNDHEETFISCQSRGCGFDSQLDHGSLPTPFNMRFT